jgi:hypothetical protein
MAEPYSDARNNPNTYGGEAQPHSTNIPIKRKSASPYEEYAKELEDKFELPAGLIKAMISQESAFNAQAVSPKGAGGLMQLMPATAKELGVTDVFDPRQNMLAGAKYIKAQIVAEGGDVEKGLQRYNMGPRAFKEYQAGKRGLPDETRNYSAEILPNIPQESIVAHNAKWGINQSSAAVSPPPNPIIDKAAGITPPASSGLIGVDAMGNQTGVPSDESKLDSMVAQNNKAYEAAYAELQKVNVQSNQSANKILDTYASNPAGVYSALDRSAAAALQLEQSIIKKQSIIRGEYTPQNENPVMAILENFAVLRSAKKTIKTDIAQLTALAKARNEINKNISDAQTNAARAIPSISDEINIRTSARNTANAATGLDLKIEGQRRAQERFAEVQDMAERKQAHKEEIDRYNKQARDIIQAANLGKIETDNLLKKAKIELTESQIDRENLRFEKELGAGANIGAFNNAALEVIKERGYDASRFSPITSVNDLKLLPKDVVEAVKTKLAGSQAVGKSLTESIYYINNQEGLTSEQKLTADKIADLLKKSESPKLENSKKGVEMSDEDKRKSLPLREARIAREIKQSPTLETDFNSDIKNALPFSKVLELNGLPLMEKLKTGGIDTKDIKSDSKLAFVAAKLIQQGTFSKKEVIDDMAAFYRSYAQKREEISGLNKLGVTLAKDRYDVFAVSSKQPFDLTKPAAIANYLDSYLSEAKRTAAPGRPDLTSPFGILGF